MDYSNIVLIRYFLPVYLLIYVLVAFVWRSYLVWKRTGINPFTFKGSDSAHDFVGRVSKLVFVLILLAVFVYSFFPLAYPYTAPIIWLEHSIERRWSKREFFAFQETPYSWE